MQISNHDFNYSQVRVSPIWNKDISAELRMHRIHKYPAKFPAFLVSKAIKLAKEKNAKIQKITDVFCGCGTTALEAKRNNIDFIGYDINPVAILIAKVKSQSYQTNRLKTYYQRIIKEYKSLNREKITINKNERIRYWFNDRNNINLCKLQIAINISVPVGKYRDFFLCGFSNILKPTSRWLTKSIKPQLDPDKKPKPVRKAFIDQFQLMLKAVIETNAQNQANVKILRKNILTAELPRGQVDLLITSPPYVTSYEYADLHQLSLLWLGYTEDYTKMRSGSIGSLYHQKISNENVHAFNEVGGKIFHRLEKIDRRKALSVAKYFIDLKQTVDKIYELLKKGGLAFFVLGNTSYKGVKVDNVRYLTACLIEKNFGDIELLKRKISLKNLTPYRDSCGKFTRNSNLRKVYSYEYIIMCEK